MANHACFGLPVDALDVVVIDDSKPMQAILRTMLHALHVRRVRIYDTLKEATAAILREPPNLVISDWRIGRHTPLRFLRTLRRQSMGPLSLVPVIIVSAHTTQSMFERAIGAGAHTILVKPLSPSVLHGRIRWLLSDAREMIPGDGGVMVIRGMAERLRSLRSRRQIHFDEPAPMPLPQSAPNDPPPSTFKLRFAETVKPRTGPKRPEETLRRMPRLKHFAALRAE